MTSVNLLDVILLILALARGIAGWRRGVFSGLLSLIGVIGGGWAGLWAGPKVVELLPAGWDTRLATTAVLIVIFLVCISLGSRLGAWLAVQLRGGGRPAVIDSIVGAVVNVGIVLGAAWFLLTAVLPFGTPGLQSMIETSRLYREIQARIPDRWATVPTRTVDTLLATIQVFGGDDPDLPVAEPDPDVVDDPEVVAARNSVVEIASHAPACSADSTGSGWVVAPGRVVTNAHVVAASQSVRVTDAAGEQFAASIVALDPDLDLAILAVDGLDAPALPRNTAQLATGEEAVAAGYPWGGPYTLRATRIRGVVTEQSSDIYGTEGIAREVYAVRGVVRPGNSGGPLIDLDGRVIGTVFAMSSLDPQTGYALTDAATAGYLDAASSLSQPVSSGGCVVD